MFETTLAGSLPKPSWLAETNKLWPQWKLGTVADLRERSLALQGPRML
jgi:methionine synthase II (cobalamin-independent)